MCLASTIEAKSCTAEPELKKLWTDANPRFRARALHLLAQIPGKTEAWVDIALADRNPDLRITGLRIARAQGLDVIPRLRTLVNDPEPQVRRECAIALRHHKSPEMPALWAKLATQFDGKLVQRYLPYELDGALRTFFDETRPALGVILETEIWPNLLHTARAQAVPMVLVNARLSERSLARGQRFAPLLRFDPDNQLVRLHHHGPGQRHPMRLFAEVLPGASVHAELQQQLAVQFDREAIADARQQQRQGLLRRWARKADNQGGRALLTLKVGVPVKGKARLNLSRDLTWNLD
jgi:hypothetical protein